MSSYISLSLFNSLVLIYLTLQQNSEFNNSLGLWFSCMNQTASFIDLIWFCSRQLLLPTTKVQKLQIPHGYRTIDFFFFLDQIVLRFFFPSTLIKQQIVSHWMALIILYILQDEIFAMVFRVLHSLVPARAPDPKLSSLVLSPIPSPPAPSSILWINHSFYKRFKVLLKIQVWLLYWGQSKRADSKEFVSFTLQSSCKQHRADSGSSTGLGSQTPSACCSVLPSVRLPLT